MQSRGPGAASGAAFRRPCLASRPQFGVDPSDRPVVLTFGFMAPARRAGMRLSAGGDAIQ